VQSRPILSVTRGRPVFYLAVGFVIECMPAIKAETFGRQESPIHGDKRSKVHIHPEKLDRHAGIACVI
jgi:hypothetical protein